MTPVLGWNPPALRREWNAGKTSVAPWWAECSKEAYNTGLDACARALKNWRDSSSGKRKGRKIGFPRFKARRRTTPSVRFTTGVIRVEADRKHVTLPRVGTLKPMSRPANWRGDWKPGQRGSCPDESALTGVADGVPPLAGRLPGIRCFVSTTG